MSSNKNDMDSMKQAVLELFQFYIADLSKEIQNKIGSEWNATGESALQSALVSAFVTFTRRLNLPLKQLGKLDVDKIPIFVSKKVKSIKKSANQSNIKGHCFVDCSFLSVKSTCLKCGQPFWGIGYQGMICQSKTFIFQLNIYFSKLLDKVNSLFSLQSTSAI